MDFPLEINEYGYLLGGARNTLEPQAVLAGHNATIAFAVYDRVPITHFTLYMNLRDGENDQYSGQRHPRQVRCRQRPDSGSARPHGICRSHDPGRRRGPAGTVTFRITFEGAMEKTNMVARLWNADLSLLTVQVLDAFEVVTEAAVDPEPTVPRVDPEPTAPGVDPEPVLKPESVVDPEPTYWTGWRPVRMWSGFDSFVLDDAGLLGALGLDHPGIDIPELDDDGARARWSSRGASR